VLCLTSKRQLFQITRSSISYRRALYLRSHGALSYVTGHPVSGHFVLCLMSLDNLSQVTVTLCQVIGCSISYHQSSCLRSLGALSHIIGHLFNVHVDLHYSAHSVPYEKTHSVSFLKLLCVKQVLLCLTTNMDYSALRPPPWAFKL